RVKKGVLLLPFIVLRDPRAGSDAGRADSAGLEPMEVEDLFPHPPDLPAMDLDHVMSDP
ncbi:hypothetical protein IWW35_005956, partial [Coemansia sp. RSA 1878]